ncbi:phospholipase A1-like [Contarinia nasturtii]|uniref:phospholipase A1-like n=1 Tax=Contarinia nasturtii TaxID=265458 RepID=UPI0012D4A774|nr:phospholipase A1-like [Contarinia nasturtii]
MSWKFHSIILVLLISHCGADYGQWGANVADKLKGNGFKQDPVHFGCIYNDRMTEFDVVKCNDKKGMLSLSEKLNNGRDLSLFFLGTGNTISRKDDRFIGSLEWFIHSGTNICYIAYAFENYEASMFNLIFYIKRILETNRVEYVAREALNLVLNVRKKCSETKSKQCFKNMSQLTVLGFSLGAHIGAYACRYFFEATNEKARRLIGLDPAAISFFVDPDKSYIQSGDADYVQIIHTSYLGTQNKKGDHDIYINSDNWGSHNNHRLAVDINMLIAARKLVIVASKTGNSKIINLQKNMSPDRVILGPNDCLVGVYSEARHIDDLPICEEDRPTYEIDFPNKSMKFY